MSRLDSMLRRLTAQRDGLNWAAEQIAGLIEQAWAHEGDIRGSVLDYDWDAFARRIVELAE